MFGLFVCRRCACITINLHEHKPRRVVLLLDNIELCDTGFFQALLRVGNGSPLESFNGFRFDVNMNMNDEHMDCFVAERVGVGQRA